MLRMPYKKQATHVCIYCRHLLCFSPLTFGAISDAGWIFAQHFCNRLGPAYLALKNVLDDANPLHAEVLNNIKRRFREETFTRQGISETILAYPDLVRSLLILEQERVDGDSPTTIDTGALRQLCDGPLPE
jgi:hypothetical protein